MIHITAAAALTLLAAAAQPAPLVADPPHECSECAAWNRPREPFRIYGNSYFIGTDGLSAVLITGDAGHVLLDGGLTQSAPLIAQNIRKLGFRLEDVKLIVASHGHFDHVGGIAALQRWTGAKVAASASTAQALQRGENTPDDPQFGFGPKVNGFPKVAGVRVVTDGETLRLGTLALTAHLTSGHTPGSTTWTFRACEGKGETACRNIVYADSLNAVSSPGFRFTGDGKTPSRADSFRRSVQKVAALPCDIIVSVHPSFTGIDEKLKQRAEKKGAAASADPFIDPQGCRVYADDAMKRLEARITEESRGGTPAP